MGGSLNIIETYILVEPRVLKFEFKVRHGQLFWRSGTHLLEESVAFRKKSRDLLSAGQFKFRIKSVKNNLRVKNEPASLCSMNSAFFEHDGISNISQACFQ